MQQVHNNHELIALIRAWKLRGKTIAFVPTMGNLHEGHLSLLQTAHEQADKLVSSIFVNPMQFGPAEDLSEYPRTIKQDCKALMEHGCDLIYLPSEADLYPEGLDHITAIQVPDVTLLYEGQFRPGHLTGVSTIVLKLFNLVQPDLAVFGKKDYQQWQMIRKMVRDLNLNINVIAGETVREENGLAMSSRNQYLSDAQRVQSAQLYHQLSLTAEQLRKGASDARQLCRVATNELTREGFEVDYFDICNQNTLQPATEGDPLVIVCAARLGVTRLIDNIEI
jgi:pantoate--beta-alanine ligase